MLWGLPLRFLKSMTVKIHKETLGNILHTLYGSYNYLCGVFWGKSEYGVLTGIHVGTYVVLQSPNNVFVFVSCFFSFNFDKLRTHTSYFRNQSDKVPYKWDECWFFFNLNFYNCIYMKLFIRYRPFIKCSI